MGLASLMEPVLQTSRLFQVGVRDLFFSFFHAPVLMGQNRLLKSQLQTLESHEATHRDLFFENARLRALIQFKERSPWNLTTAEVIGREHTLWSRTLLLDKGHQEGIQIGQAVITPVGLVGRISEVGRSTSRSILITDPHFRVAATVSRPRLSGLVMGRSPGECLLTYVPPGTELKSGDLIVTSGGLSFCPGGIPIGSISTVFSSSSDLYRSARFRPAAELGSIEEVMVVAWPRSDSVQ